MKLKLFSMIKYLYKINYVLKFKILVLIMEIEVGFSISLSFAK